MQFSDWLTGLGGVLIEAAIETALMVGALFLWTRLLRLFLRRARISESIWDDAILRAVRPPITAYIAGFGLSIVADTVFGEYLRRELVGGESFRLALLVFCLFWLAYRGLSEAGREAKLQEKRLLRIGKTAAEIDANAIFAVTRILRMAVIVVAALTAMETAGVSISGLLAFGGLSGIILGLALKDVLSNFFSGFLIYWERPFSLGEWIRCPAVNIEGVVEEIGWRTTRLRSFDKRPLFVPNSIFTENVVENAERMTNRRIFETFGVRYEDLGKLPAIIKDARAMLVAHPEIDSDSIQMTYFDKYDSYSLNFFIYVFTRTTGWKKYHKVKEDVLFQIAAIVGRHGAEFAFPTRTVYYRSDSPLSQDALMADDTDDE